MLTTNKRIIFVVVYCLLIAFSIIGGSSAFADPIPTGALADDNGPVTAPAAAPADAASSNFKISGFLSIIGGNVFNGSFGPNYQANAGPATLNGISCPCYIADYSNAGVYGSNFSIKPETHAGVQIQYNFTPDLNFVGQVTAHTQEDSPAIQWAYFSYRINESWEVHVGRQRIPMYYYSQFQDVGFAYPWIDPPP